MSLTAAQFTNLWEVERKAALFEVRIKADLARGVPHEMLAETRAFEKIVGRMPTTEEILGGDLRRRAWQMLGAPV